jgi:hypothetical protein
MAGPYDGLMTEPRMTEPPIASPLEEATARVGDRWTLLLVQALLEGPRRFNELLEALPGIAPNVLAQRGADHSGAPDPGSLRHLACGTPLEARWYCPTCAHPVDDDDAGDLRFV